MIFYSLFTKDLTAVIVNDLGNLRSGKCDSGGYVLRGAAVHNAARQRPVKSVVSPGMDAVGILIAGFQSSALIGGMTAVLSQLHKEYGKLLARDAVFVSEVSLSDTACQTVFICPGNGGRVPLSVGNVRKGRFLIFGGIEIGARDLCHNLNDHRNGGSSRG